MVDLSSSGNWDCHGNSDMNRVTTGWPVSCLGLPTSRWFWQWDDYKIQDLAQITYCMEWGRILVMQGSFWSSQQAMSLIKITRSQAVPRDSPISKGLSWNSNLAWRSPAIATPKCDVLETPGTHPYLALCKCNSFPPGIACVSGQLGAGRLHNTCYYVLNYDR